MNIKKFLAIIISISILIVGVLLVSNEDDKDKNKLNNRDTADSVHDGMKIEKPTFGSYEGQSLKIAVVGELPEVKEKGLIHFSTIDELKKLHSLNQQQFDAIFIMKEYLHQAAKKEYANIYKTSKIPFFFIQSEKIYLAFTKEDLSYEEASDLSNKDIYAVGYTTTNGEGRYWGYGLYNGKENDKNIKNVYTRIFKRIKNEAIQ
ncbi:hypothetical protein [Virgibacillus siamensis]|uniref:hypothetical protein n=1 Tax=Virgibacillus siamensis TaxID=480071 RepID=UPI0009862821|nr:hypothetical protein [Virgibacillus siamensis]